MKIANPPAKPVLIFDGGCSLCVSAVSRWRRATKDRVLYLSFQDPEVQRMFPKLTRDQLQESIQFIETDGLVIQGAEGIFKLLRYSSSLWHWPLWCYERILGVKPISEWFYRFIARRRSYWK